MKESKSRRETIGGISVAGSILSAVAASACCIGPAVLALLGAGTVGLSGVIGVYRPYFIGLSVVLLGVAFYLTYRKREVKCEDGTCKKVGAGKWEKISVWFAAVVTVAVIAMPSISAAHAVSAEPLKAASAAYKPAAAATVQSAGDSCCEIPKKPREGK